MADQHVQFFSDSALFQEKERLYIEVRRREGRVLPDEVVRELPFIPDSSPFAREWAWRRRSFSRFEQYLLRRFSGKPIHILDLGCGNGWMAGRLSRHPEWEIVAADLNQTELEQGARLFAGSNLRFVYTDVIQTPFPEDTFDLIVLAASVQYFQDWQALSAILHHMLKPCGEIHLLDSPFYKNEGEKAAARQRTREYYSNLGVPEMAAYYHHHLWPELRAAGGKNLNNRLYIKFLQKTGWLAHFPWVVLRQSR